MARRIDEGDQARPGLHLIGTDVLGDATGLAGHHIGLADGIEQRRLAVIDVAHDGDHRRARLQRALLVGVAGQALDHVGLGHALDLVPHLLGDELRQVGIDHVVDRVHLTLLHQHLDDVDGALRHAVGKLLDGDRLGDHHLAAHLLGRHLEALGLLLETLGPAAEGRHRTSALAPLPRSGH